MIYDDDNNLSYWNGFRDGQNALLTNFKKEIKNIRELKLYYEDVLEDPDKLANLAIDNPEINSAITTAVVSLLLTEVQVDNAKQQS